MIIWNEVHYCCIIQALVLYWSYDKMNNENDMK